MFETVYDIANAPPEATYPLALLGAALGTVAAIVASRKRSTSPIVRIGVPSLGAILLGAGALAMYAGDAFRDEMTRAVAQDDCLIVEGRVHVLREENVHGHTPGDLVEVGGRRIELSYFDGTAGYRDTIAHGGVLTEGADVRVWLYRGRIGRLDLRSSGDQVGAGDSERE